MLNRHVNRKRNFTNKIHQEQSQFDTIICQQTNSGFCFFNLFNLTILSGKEM